MTNYKLEKNEFVIMQQGSVKLYESGELIDIEEIVLTNLNLILVRNVNQGLFQQTTMLKRCPLGQLHCNDDGVPQILITKVRDRWQLQAPFMNGAIAISFSSDAKRTAQRWAQGIAQASVGNYAQIQTEDALPAEVSNIVDGVTGMLGAVLGSKATPSNKIAASQPKRTPMISTKCSGCHAPISGKRGATATCPYCDTVQTL